MFRNSKLGPVVLLICAAFGFLQAAEGDLPSNLHWWVVKNTENGQKADFFIVLKNQADVSQARGLSEKTDKGRYVFSALTGTAAATQAPLRNWLDSRGATYRPFWIVNAILVEGGDRKLAVEAALRPDVDRVEGNPVIHNDFPQPETIEDLGVSQAPMAPEAVEWNITKVNAPSVWALGFHGEGIVVGGQDTGYRWTHAALKGKYRGWNGVTADHNYNWHDAIHTTGSSCGANSPVPCDDYGHGTHTMGTVLGDDGGANQIGMAPKAKWIGCRNMNVGDGTPATYLECFQFFLAPTKLNGTSPDPTKAPDVTNNSWGCPPSEGCSWNTLQTAVDNQEAAGIMTVVSAGNSGSSCNTITDPPALYLSAYTVGSTDSVDHLSSFSSRGYATGTNAMKPNIVAPGSGVRSAYGTGDTNYATLSGTSMAAPHVAGAVALLWSARACLVNQQVATETVLNNTALDLPGIVESCGGNYTTGPNNSWGNGRLDILAAVNAGCPCTAPGAPALIDAVGNCAAVHLAWTAGSGSTSSYNVYRGASAGGPYTKLGGMPTTGTTFSDTTAVAGATYVYVVTGACDAGGVTESAHSNELSGSRKANGAACDDGNPCTQADACQSGACAGVPKPAPSEVDNDVRVDREDSSAVISWNVAFNATTSDLLRGSLDALPVGPGGGDETCLGDDLAAAEFTDSDVPPVDGGFWYLIRGANACAEKGPWGFEWIDGAPGAARASTTCP